MTSNDSTTRDRRPAQPGTVGRGDGALDLADHVFAALPQLRFHPTAKRIRADLDGTVIVDSTRAVLVWEPGRIVPSHAVPATDIAGSLVEVDAGDAEQLVVRVGDGPPFLDPRTAFGHHTAPGRVFDIDTGAAVLPGAAFAPAGLDGLLVLDFDAFDQWREEDEVLVAHARNPFTTVETRRSSRSVVVEIAGARLAASTRSVMLFETGLPTRYYLPRSDVRMDLLRPSATTTSCAYKGRATYWSAEVDGTDIVDVAWTYENPDNYAAQVVGLICFFNEQVDITLDGAVLDRPRTPWS